MKEIKFRIIELQTHQVLLTKDFDDDEDGTPLLTISLFLDGVKIKQKLAYSTEEKRDTMFDYFSEDQAKSILKSSIEMFENSEDSK